ncbi:MAG: conjugal transfer protein TraX [Bacilli bacterium]|nr:conjugal transfer protein TraX [Bacilli bacterium]
MKKILTLNSFWLRLIALITMTIDHIGAALKYADYYVLRIIGRLAIPIFFFLAVEGALKTSNRKKYIFRLGILAVVIGIALGVLAFVDSPYQTLGLSGNIFIDILLIVVSVAILESPNKKIKPLIALPIAISIFSYVVLRLEGCGCDGIYYWFFPPLRPQTGYYGYMMGMGFYLAKKYAPSFINIYAPAHVGDEQYEQLIRNIFSVLALVVSAISFLITNSLFDSIYEQQMDGIQSYAILAGILILLYNGKKGYNAKWFKVAYYLYYPIHLGIIGLVFFIIGV